MTDTIKQIVAVAARLSMHEIDTRKLCYLLDDAEWQDMLKWAASYVENPQAAIGPTGEVEVYGMKVRKLKPATVGAEHE